MSIRFTNYNKKTSVMSFFHFHLLHLQAMFGRFIIFQLSIGPAGCNHIYSVMLIVLGFGVYAEFPIKEG